MKNDVLKTLIASFIILSGITTLCVSAENKIRQQTAYYSIVELYNNSMYSDCAENAKRLIANIDKLASHPDEDTLTATYILLSNCLLAEGHTEATITALQNFTSVKTNNQEQNNNQLAKIKLYLGNIYIEEGQPLKALSVLKDVEKEHKNLEFGITESIREKHKSISQELPSNNYKKIPTSLSYQNP